MFLFQQWKRGSANGVMNGTDAGGGGVFNLAGNANDPWSNTPAKRNSGADWPQSSATTPGDMPKSPDSKFFLFPGHTEEKMGFSFKSNLMVTKKTNLSNKLEKIPIVCQLQPALRMKLVVMPALVV